MRSMILVLALAFAFGTTVAIAAQNETKIRPQEYFAKSADIQAQLHRESRKARARAAVVSAKLSPQQIRAVKQIGRELAHDQNSAFRMWQQFVAKSRPAAGDVDGLIQLVLSEAYEQSALDAKREADKLERKREMVGDDSQMMQLQLQDALQKHTQIMQAASNIMKVWNDAIKSIISNMK